MQLFFLDYNTVLVYDIPRWKQNFLSFGSGRDHLKLQPYCQTRMLILDNWSKPWIPLSVKNL